MDDHQLMQCAIDAARKGIAAGQTPFGAAIARDGELIVATHNRVWTLHDPTAHAEVLAVREAARQLGTIDLSDCVLYSTCEPCPMCFTAIHWSRIVRMYFGARIADAEAGGFRELSISNERMRELGGSEIEIIPDLMREQCAALFKEWQAAGQARTY